MSRAIFAIRLSVLADSSTSPERQLEHCSNVTALRGWEHVGTAEDLDVSATKFSPFKRPGLGPWLTDTPPAPWDVLVVWRLDRLVRSSRDLADLLEWCQERGKGFVSATEGFDLGTPFGKAMVAIIAALGELEADTTRLRVTDAHRALRGTDRLPSGVPPFGYVPVPHPSGRGVGYAKDPGMQDDLHDMASWLMSGWSLTRITEKLNATVLTAKDRSRIRSKKKPKGGGWQTWLVRACLSSPATQGYKMVGGAAKGRPALDADGRMIRVAEPSFDDETWEQLQEKLAERAARGKARTHSPNPMLGVGRCGECGRALTQSFSFSKKYQRSYRYYKCSGNPRCKGVSVKADDLDRLLENTFLLAEGDHKVRERVFVPGTDNRTEIETLRSSLRRLRAESDAGLVDNEEEWLQRLSGLTQRLRDLEPEPYLASGWMTRETEQTYRDAWQDADPEGRRKLLQDARARVTVFRGGKVDVGIEWGRSGSAGVASSGR